MTPASFGGQTVLDKTESQEQLPHGGVDVVCKEVRLFAYVLLTGHHIRESGILRECGLRMDMLSSTRRELLRLALGHWSAHNAIPDGKEIVNLVHHCTSRETSQYLSASHAMNHTAGNENAGNQVQQPVFKVLTPEMMRIDGGLAIRRRACFACRRRRSKVSYQFGCFLPIVDSEST